MSENSAMSITRGFFFVPNNEQKQNGFIGFATICWELDLANGEALEQRLNQIMVKEHKDKEGETHISLPARKSKRGRRFETLFWGDREYRDDILSAAEILARNWLKYDETDSHTEGSIYQYTYNFVDGSYGVRTRGDNPDEVIPTSREMAHSSSSDDSELIF